MFEAGAISKVVDAAHVCPLLFGVEPTDLKGPLAQFQATRFEKGDMKKLFRTINGRLAQEKLADEVADNVFEKWWPDLISSINSAIEKTREAMKGKADIRTDRDILEELLATVRNMSRTERLAGGPARSPLGNPNYDVLISLLKEFFEPILLTPGELRKLDAALEKAISYFQHQTRLNPNIARTILIQLEEFKKSLPDKLLAEVTEEESEDSKEN